nr:hypothetical protein CFP56_24598 [Quercus suber]
MQSSLSIIYLVALCWRTGCFNCSSPLTFIQASWHHVSNPGRGCTEVSMTTSVSTPPVVGQRQTGNDLHRSYPRTSTSMGLRMDDIHAPTVQSGPTSGLPASAQDRKSSFHELVIQKENVEAELSALGSVLDSVSVGDVVPVR